MKDIHLSDASPFFGEDGELKRYLNLLLKCMEDVSEHNKIVVKRCDKCEHDTLQQQRHVYIGGGDVPFVMTKERYYCLNCGTLWEVTHKAEMREITSREG